MSYRQGSGPIPLKTAFILCHGGLGDFIYYTRAIQYAIESNKHLNGIIAVPKYFEELAKKWLPSSKSFKLRIYESTKAIKNEVAGTKHFPRYQSEYDSINTQFFHPMEVGFAVYAYTNPVPQEWRTMPQIHGKEKDLSKFDLPKRYAVVTTEATAKTRTLPRDSVIEVMNYLIEKNITPVLLGKKDIIENYKSSSSIESIAWTRDLRERTSIMEAACILANAEFVVGLDNGLLHLAACSTVPIVFATTTVRPELRAPPRRVGKTIMLSPPENLECRHCFSNMRFFMHNFNECVYQDYACCKSITGESLISAIEQL